MVLSDANTVKWWTMWMSLQSLLTKLITFATLLVWELLPKFIPQLLLFQDSVYLCWNNTIQRRETQREQNKKQKSY